MSLHLSKKNFTRGLQSRFRFGSSCCHLLCSSFQLQLPFWVSKKEQLPQSLCLILLVWFWLLFTYGHQEHITISQSPTQQRQQPQQLDRTLQGMMPSSVKLTIQVALMALSKTKISPKKKVKKAKKQGTTKVNNKK